MSEGGRTDSLDAGDFDAWLDAMLQALRGQSAMNVPCGSCTACCRSSQFVHIGRDEKETLRRVPSELVFPAPGSDGRDVVLGFDARGRCPLLTDDGCSVYAVRPRTCRSYDCRVFAAAEVFDTTKPDVTRQARRWVFGYTTPSGRTRHRAVRDAARYLQRHPDVVSSDGHDVSVTALVLAALELHDLFMASDHQTSPASVRAVLLARRADARQPEREQSLGRAADR